MDVNLTHGISELVNDEIKRGVPKTAARYAQAIVLHKLGMPWAEIGERIGASGDSVQNMCNKFGYSLRAGETRGAATDKDGYYLNLNRFVWPTVDRLQALPSVQHAFEQRKTTMTVVTDKRSERSKNISKALKKSWARRKRAEVKATEANAASKTEKRVVTKPVEQAAAVKAVNPLTQNLGGNILVMSPEALAQLLRGGK